MEMIDRLILRMAEWVLRRRITLSPEVRWSPDRITKTVKTELNAIPATITGAMEYGRGEVDILSDRLSRRFDPGMALEEATQRAQVQKRKLLQEAEGMGLTSTQLASLEFQKQMRKRTIKETK